MAIWNTPLYTSQVPGAGYSEAVKYPLAKVARGKLRIVECPYTISAGATEAASDLIYLTLLQPGDRVLPAYSKVVWQNPGTTLTVEFGDSVTANRYSGTITLSNTAGAVSFDSAPVAGTYTPTDITVPAYTGANPPQPVPPPNATDQTIVIMKILSAAALTAGQIIWIGLGVVGE
jgi:hypothetical protein